MMMLVEVANGKGLGEKELVDGNEVGDRTDNVEIVEWRRISMFRQCWCDGDGGEEKPHLPPPPLCYPHHINTIFQHQSKFYWTVLLLISVFSSAKWVLQLLDG